MGLSWTVGLSRGAWPRLLQVGQPESFGEESLFGHKAQGVSFQCRDDHVPLQVRVDFAMLQDLPMVLARMHIRSVSKQDLRLGRLGFASSGDANPKGSRHAWEPSRHRPHEGGLDIPGPREAIRFFTNGWQSWSFAGTLASTDQQPRTRLALLSRPVFENPETGRPKRAGHFVSDMFGAILQPSLQAGLLAGFVSQQQAFGSLEVNLGSQVPGLRLWESGDGYLLRPGQEFLSDWACFGWLGLEQDEPMEAYLDLAAHAAGVNVPEAVPIGWSSWYYFYETADRTAVEGNVDWLIRHRESLPVGLVQLDDGFEADVGNWFSFAPGFKDGVEPVSQTIVEAGMTPGLWLAPYIAKPRSAWARAHPDWVLRRIGGRPSNAGYNWNTFTVGLDPTHPGVEEAVTALVTTAVQDWGFEFLKLDFLYAAGLPARRHDPSTTRAQAMHKAVTTIRRAAGDDVWLLGCGCPLGSGIGVFDSMRIGPDVAPRWNPAYQGVELFFQHEPGLPSMRNGLRTALNRAMFNRKWWINDPDCLILRDRDSHLSQDEVQGMVSIMALLSGSLIDSDDLRNLSPERSNWLTKLLPPLPSQARVHDRFDRVSPELVSLKLAGAVGEWRLVCVINWDSSANEAVLDPKMFGLDPSVAWGGIDFWRETPMELSPSERISIPPHGVRLFSMRCVDDSTPTWLGDTLHISQGLEVSEWVTSERDLLARLSPGHRTNGAIWLRLPDSPLRASLNGTEVQLLPVSGSIYRLDVELDGDAEFLVGWGG
jgi:alpha-galactosidase